MVLSGADRLETVHPILSRGRVGLMTNPTGMNREMRSTVDLLREKAIFRLAAKRNDSGCAFLRFPQFFLGLILAVIG